MIGSHCAEELLESYVLNRLPDETAADVEEHLLICDTCRLRVDEAELYLAAAAAATAQLEKEDQFQKSRREGRFAGWWVPKPVWAGAFALLVIAVSLPLLLRNQAEPRGVSDVTLTASRGADEPLLARAKAGSITLHMDTRELPADRVYWLRLVDSEGSEVWGGPVSVTRGTELVVKVPKSIRKGRYWVRIFADEGTRLLREYGLRVQ